ncbi:MAG: ISAon1 family transposase N-terminal region protein [Prevotella sp.]
MKSIILHHQPIQPNKMRKTPTIDYKDVLSLFLPKGMLDYFDITEASDMGEYYMICLVGKDIKPEELSDLPLVSKGFHKPITITDFPVRDHTVYLRVTRRHWKDKLTGKSYSRDWNVVAHGTRITAEFGAFLKELP